jgi:hypothetical protein
VALGHLDWPPTKNRYALDALLCEHIVQYRSANETSRAREDEMHVADGEVLRTLSQVLGMACEAVAAEG